MRIAVAGAINLSDNAARDLGFARTPEERALEAGTLFSAGQMQLSPDVAGNVVIVRLRNAAGSGVTVRVVAVEWKANVARPVLMRLLTPAAAALGALDFSTNRLGGGAAPVASATGSTNTAVDPTGTITDRHHPVVNELYRFVAPVQLPADFSMSVYAQAAGSLTTDRHDVKLYWRE